MEEGEYGPYLSKPLWLTHCESPVVSVKLPFHDNLSDAVLKLHSCEAWRLAMLIFDVVCECQNRNMFDNFFVVIL